MMPNPFSFVQLLGYATFLLVVIGYLHKNEKRMLSITAAGLGIWVIHTFLLGALTTSLTSILNCVHCYGAIVKEPKV